MSKIDLRKYIILMFVLTVGIICGTIYSVNAGEATESAGYLTGFFSEVGESDKFRIFVNAIKENGIILACFFISGFVKAGVLVPIGITLKKGFSAGFSAGMFYQTFGAKGMLIAISVLPKNILLMLGMIVFGTVCMNYSFLKEKFEKNFLTKYFMWTILTVAIFSAAAFLEGYITTIFMNFIAKQFI